MGLLNLLLIPITGGTPRSSSHCCALNSLAPLRAGRKELLPPLFPQKVITSQGTRSATQVMFHGHLRQLYTRLVAKCHLAPIPGCPSPHPGQQPQLMYLPRRTTSTPRLCMHAPPTLCKLDGLRTSWVEVFLPFPLTLLMLTTQQGTKSSRRCAQAAHPAASQV